MKLVSWLEFNVPFQHKYGYIRDEAGWMKTTLSTEVDLGPGHILLDGVPALRETGTAAPIFSARVYCGHMATVTHLSYC